MTVRNVDSKVLLELAAALRQGRNDLEGRFNTARSRVDSAPGGWNRQSWDGIPSFIRMELEALDRDQRELVERAAKIDIVAAVHELPEGLPLSALKFLLSVVSGSGFSFYLAGGAVTGLVAAVSGFTKEFTAKNGKPPVGADFVGLKLDLGNKTAGSSAQLKPVRSVLPDGTYGSRYTGKVVVNGKVLSDADLFDRARGIDQAYRDKLGRPPTDAEYDAAMRSGETLEEIGVRLGQPKLTVPFQSQWNGTNGAANCGPASLVMAAGALGHPLAYSGVVASIRNRDDDDSTNDIGGHTDFKSKEYMEVLKGAGLEQTSVTSLDELKKALREGRPVVIGVNTRVWTEVPYFKRDGMVTDHIVVVTGVADGKVLVNDPLATKFNASGAVVADPQRGTGFEVPLDEFIKSAGGDGSFYASAIGRQ